MKLSLNALYLDLLDDLANVLPVDWFLDPNFKVHSYNLTRKQFAAVSMMRSFYKKNVDRVSPEADARALAKFLASDNHCQEWVLRPETSSDEQLLGEFRNSIYKFFYPTALSSFLDFPIDFFEKGGVGPGSSIGARANDFYTKLFDSPLAATSQGIVSIYRHYTSCNPSWTLAESERLNQHGEARIVAGNRLSFAPKNDDISRVICTEPVLNMYGQLGIGALIGERLKSRGIDLSTQPSFNRELAQLGSATDSMATLDLESASDTVALKMCRTFLPSPIMGMLEGFRSPKCTLPNGKVLELNMVSSMGNGFTFALETAIFYCVVEAVYRTLGLPMRRSSNAPEGVRLGNFGVFGDDIIVTTEAVRSTTRLLHLLGFVVNDLKSFYKGPFRESCGGDYFNGFPVRGVYIKSLRTTASRYVAINRLNQWTAQTGIALSSTVQRLVKTVPYLPVPVYSNDDAGIRMPYSMIKGLRRDKDTGSVIYKAYVNKPSKIKIKECDVVVPRGHKLRHYNPEGLLLAFLRGDIDNSSISVKQGTPRYYAKKALSPNWDYMPTVSSDCKTGDIGWRQLETALALNLYS